MKRIRKTKGYSAAKAAVTCCKKKHYLSSHNKWVINLQAVMKKIVKDIMNAKAVASTLSAPSASASATVLVVVVQNFSGESQLKMSSAPCLFLLLLS